MSKTSTNQDIIKDIYRELEENKQEQFKINLFPDLEINFELENVLSEINKKFNGKIVTNISEEKNYCRAEEYHQKYLEK